MTREGRQRTGRERREERRGGREKEEKVQTKNQKKNLSGTRMNVTVPLIGTVDVPWERRGVKNGAEIETGSKKRRFDLV